MRKRRKIMLLAVGVIAYRFPFFKTFAALLCRRQIHDASSFAAIEPADTTVNDGRIACSSLYACAVAVAGDSKFGFPFLSLADRNRDLLSEDFVPPRIVNIA